MALVLNEEQQLLKDSAAGFLAEKATVEHLRALRDSRSETGYDADVWAETAEMGFTAMVVDEAYGGVGFGMVGAGVVAEEMGKNLSASPWFASSVVAADLINSMASDTQKEALLGPIVEGSNIVTLAVDEGGHHDPEGISARAEKTDGGYKLYGLKSFVPDAHVATQYLVVARTSGSAGDKSGLTVFLLDRGTQGLIVDQSIMADSRNWGRLTMEGVAVTSDAIIGSVDDAFTPLDKTLDKARVVIAAELLGISRACFADTMEYLKDRKQFGVAIGTFQALQHRAAHLFSDIELAHSSIIKALQAADADSPALATLASVAKAKACQVAELATNEAVQMFGGIGMTDECNVGFYMKRARIAQALYGDYNFHAGRYADLRGF